MLNFLFHIESCFTKVNGWNKKQKCVWELIGKAQTRGDHDFPACCTSLPEISSLPCSLRRKSALPIVKVERYSTIDVKNMITLTTFWMPVAVHLWIWGLPWCFEHWNFFFVSHLLFFEVLLFWLLCFLCFTSPVSFNKFLLTEDELNFVPSVNAR